MYKTALVTGGARRLGRAVAVALAKEGLDVVIHCNKSRSEATQVQREISNLGVHGFVVSADLGNPEAAKGLMAEAKDKAGPIDVLINCASIFPEGRLDTMEWSHLQENVTVNAFAPLVLCREFANQTTTGTIVNFLDSRYLGMDPSHAAYHLSKRMLFTMTRMLAWELAPRIRVNAVAPGLILPPAGAPDDYIEQKKKEVPLRRQGTPDDISRAVWFLVNSEFITGQTIFVDGGRHMERAFYG